MRALVVLFGFLALVVLGKPKPSITPEYFFPFGPANGDSTAPRGDDNYVGPIDYEFKYFGEAESVLFVNNNGLLSFRKGVSAFTATGLEEVEVPVVAAFWGDFDTRNNDSGRLTYRSVSDMDTLTEAQNLIRTALNRPSFSINHMFLATWERVGYYKTHTDKLNTIQIAILTGEASSAIVLNYGDLQWTTGDASDGVNGLGGDRAAAGFSKGDQETYFELQGSRTRNVLNINKRTNLFIDGKPLTGQYAWFVDDEVAFKCCAKTRGMKGIPHSVSVDQLSDIPVASVGSVTADSCTSGEDPVQESAGITVKDVNSDKGVVRTWTYIDPVCGNTVLGLQYFNLAAPPSIKTPADKGTSDFSPVIEGFADIGADVSVYIDNKLYATVKADELGKFMVKNGKKLAAGTHSIYLKTDKFTSETTTFDAKPPQLVRLKYPGIVHV